MDVVGPHKANQLIVKKDGTPPLRILPKYRTEGIDQAREVGPHSRHLTETLLDILSSERQGHDNEGVQVELVVNDARWSSDSLKENLRLLFQTDCQIIRRGVQELIYTQNAVI